MKRGLFFTAYNRIPYLQETLHSWDNVRGLSRWNIWAFIEPSPVQDQVADEFREWFHRAGLVAQVRINPQRYGVLHHPWVGFEQMFDRRSIQRGNDFVVRTEDDIVVSSDILEYFEWASDEFLGDSDVATVNAHSKEPRLSAPSAVVKDPDFNPLVWGTWHDRWDNVIGPSWDHDYSTHNGTPGEHAGWDWNLNERVLPTNQMTTVRPRESRSSHVGVIGTHGTAENFIQCPTFREHRSSVRFSLADSKWSDFTLDDSGAATR